jgi:hypothetical protein
LIVVSKLAIQRTKPETNGHSDVVSLDVNHDVAKRCLKKAQAGAETPEAWAERRRQQSWTTLEDVFQPTAEDLAEERQSSLVVLVKMEREQVKAVPHTCTDDPNPVYDCPGLAATRRKLVNLARWRGYSTAADDIANNCFIAALRYTKRVNCLCRFASHGRRWRYAVIDQDRDEVKHERWAKLSAERQGLVMTWVKDEDGTDEGHWDGYISTDTGLQGAAVDRYHDLMAVIEASKRPNTKLAVEQIMTGTKEMQAAGLPTLTRCQLSREKGYIRRDYDEMIKQGEIRWLAEQLFKQPAVA